MSELIELREMGTLVSGAAIRSRSVALREAADGGVSLDVALDADLSAKFSRPVQPDSVTFTATRDGIAISGTTTVDEAGIVATFTPMDPLMPATEYHVHGERRDCPGWDGTGSADHLVVRDGHDASFDCGGSDGVTHTGRGC